MCFRGKMYCLYIVCALWIIPLINADQDNNTCNFYYWKVDWDSANKTCNKENKFLLCYNSKKEIDDITEAFRLTAYGEAELEMWLSHKNCSRPNEQERCLSLHIEKSHIAVWHFFQTDCRKKLPFVCCIKEGFTSTTRSSTYMSTALTKTSTTTSSIVETSSLFDHCTGEQRRGLIWPYTKIGTTAILPCPGNSVGEAKWICEKGGRWEKRGPNYRSCRSKDIMDIKQKLHNNSVSETLLLIGSAFEDRGKDVFVEDLADVVSIIKILPDKLSTELDKIEDGGKWAEISDVVEKSTSIVDQLIELHSTWKDVEKKKRPVMGTDLLSSVDGFGVLLADTMTGRTNEKSVIGKNIVVQVLRTKYGDSMQLPQWTMTSQYSRRSSIILNEGYDKQLNPDRGNISVVFALYSNLTHILETKISQKKGMIPATLNSAVVSATVTQARKIVGISSKVSIFVEHLNSSPNDTACVFWNMGQNNWDTTGCTAESTNSSYTLCVCDHLTNFAVLMDYKGVLDDLDQLAFNYITIIGCSLSVICLAICVVVFSCYSYHSNHAWGLRYVIHRNLCLTLLVANLVLVVGIDKTDNENVCAVVAGVLHYFFLSAFSWMLLEGVHIYMLLVVVFASRRSHWEKYYLFGYGFPLVIVAITAIARPMYYGTDDACWLSIEKGTIWAFMGPVACILMLNVAALILAQYKASNISVKNDNTALVKRWLRITFILFPVLGITWLFGFMYVGKRFVVIGYLFAIFNSLQGFCIFVCHCLMDKNARKMVLASLKKTSASVTTGSTGTQKKQNNSKENMKNDSESAQNDAAVKEENTNKSYLVSNRKSKKAWGKWHKPWTFCFDMTVVEKESNKSKKNPESPTKPVMIHWNNLRDKQ